MTPTAHGKSECDGLGGNVKRRVREASLRGEEILNAETIFTFCKTNEAKYKSSSFDYIEKVPIKKNWNSWQTATKI